jgi:dolichol-phosphate mannosyltransferase
VILNSENQSNQIAVVIPAFHVAQHIGKVIRNLPGFIDHIIVVDDASQDGTSREVESIRDKRIHLTRHEKNQGVGGAMVSGYRLAFEKGADIAVKIDGDDQMDPDYIQQLITPIIEYEADYAKGNRFLGLSFLTKLASGYWHIFDPTNGFTALHREAYQLLNKDAIDRDYFFETSMLIQLQRTHALACDVPIPAKYDGQTSHLSPLKSLFTFPPRLFKYFLQRVIFQYFLFDFTAVSLYLLVGIPAILFGFVWGVWKWYQSYLTGIVASTGTVLIAVLPIIIGIQFITSAVSLDIASRPDHPIQSGGAFSNRKSQ